MNKYKRFFLLVLVAELFLFLFFNGRIMVQNKSGEHRIYRVEIARLVQELQDKAINEVELLNYNTILRISEFKKGEICNHDYVVEEVNGKLYRIEYQNQVKNNTWLYMNIAMITSFIFIIIILLYIDKKVLRPFQNMSRLSLELAKGNLSVPIKEERSKFFGKFLWGMDMLREKLEDNKEKELAFQREKKTLILSLSHDIKTPLSAIKLSAKALSENLYDTEEKKKEVLHSISRNVKEIEKFVNEITTASREDFLNLSVQQEEVYLLDVMQDLESYYKEKLAVLHIDFIREEMANCLLHCDKNRIIEVLQNIMENAIKYGDGKQIWISDDEEEDCKLIYIENTGCKLEKEELSHLFDSFYRGSNSKGINGNGLGLYICKKLMKMMEGDVFASIENHMFKIGVVIRKA